MKRGLVKFTFLGLGLFVLLFLILIIPEGKSNPDTGIINCSVLSTAGEYYFLSNDIHNDQITDNCINVSASNIVFDCQGHYIYSIQNFSGVYSNSTNTTIKNCNITIGSGGNTSAKGIYLNGISSSNSTIFNNSFFGDSYAGIYLSTSNNNNLALNNGTSNSSFGIYLSSSSNNNLTSNNGTSNLNYGIYLFSSKNNILTSNIGVSSSERGIYLFSSSHNNTLMLNRGISNTGNGIDIQSSNNNTLTLNVGINNITGHGIHLIFSINNTLTSNTGASNSSVGIYLQSSYNNLIINNNATGVGNSVGFYLLTSLNNTLINNTGISNSSFGIYLSSSSNNNLTSNVGISNSSAGISFDQSLNNSLTNNVGISNSNYGIKLNSLSNNNTLISNIGISNSSAGIYISRSNNNTIKNLTSNNNKYGLYISFSNNTAVSNLTAKNNSFYGIVLEGASYNNIIINSFMQLNNGSAFSLNSTGISPQSNTFYNNYFNNSNQYSNISTPSVNFFNTTKTSGTNIVGGIYLAGNYWAAPNGSGFSQTCTSSTDGICDTAYSFDGINYDYLPLTCVENWTCDDWGTCISGKQTRSCRDMNLCQTYKYKPDESQTCTVIDLGGHTPSGGGGGGSFSILKNINNIISNAPIEIFLNSSKMDLTGLILNVKQKEENASINVTKVNEEKVSGLPVGKLYQLFQIQTLGITSEDILNATLNFRINKTFLTENNISFHHKDNRYWLVQNDIVGNIAVYRNPTGNANWLPLITNFSGEDNNAYYFSSYTKGFSTFAIFLNKYDCLPNSARCSENNVQICLGNSTWLVTEHCSDTCSNNKCTVSFTKSNEFFIVIGTIIAGVIAIGLILIFGKRKIKVRKIRKKIKKRN